MCTLNQVCVPASSESCLSPPCLPYGDCRNLESGRRVKPPSVPSPSTCWPNQAVLSNNCARLTLLLDRVKLPQGMTVEGLCGDLRRLLANQQAMEGLDDSLILLCDLKVGYNDTVEVTLVSVKRYRNTSQCQNYSKNVLVLITTLSLQNYPLIECF